MYNPKVYRLTMGLLKLAQAVAETLVFTPEILNTSVFAGVKPSYSLFFPRRMVLKEPGRAATQLYSIRLALTPLGINNQPSFTQHQTIKASK